MPTPIKRCPNCHGHWIEGDKYCRYCGARKDQPSFIDIPAACIYGPPPRERQHTCTKCGYTWKTRQMVDDERWCPHCGGEAPVTDEADRLHDALKRHLEDHFSTRDVAAESAARCMVLKRRLEEYCREGAATAETEERRRMFLELLEQLQKGSDPDA